MRVGGHRFREHLRLLWPLFALIAAVFAARLALDAAGVMGGVVRAFSVTGAAALSVLIAVFLLHQRGFSNYTSVVMASLLLVAWGQLLVSAAIIFSVLTGMENVFTRPEFSVHGDDPYHLRHIIGHLTFGIGAGTLFGAGMGCLILWLLRSLVPVRPRA